MDRKIREMSRKAAVKPLYYRKRRHVLIRRLPFLVLVGGLILYAIEAGDGYVQGAHWEEPLIVRFLDKGRQAPYSMLYYRDEFRMELAR